jgi:hypothetical protein
MIKYNSKLFTLSRKPDELYKNGLQRESFIPCIELIKKQWEVKCLDSPTGSFLPLLIRLASVTLKHDRLSKDTEINQ